jgi:hypothetical protein
VPGAKVGGAMCRAHHKIRQRSERLGPAGAANRSARPARVMAGSFQHPRQSCDPDPIVSFHSGKRVATPCPFRASAFRKIRLPMPRRPGPRAAKTMSGRDPALKFR